MLGLILTESFTHALTAFSDLPEDVRNDVSYFACMTRHQDVSGVEVFNVADDGILLQIVKNLKGSSPAAGWCASCEHSYILL